MNATTEPDAAVADKILPDLAAAIAAGVAAALVTVNRAENSEDDIDPDAIIAAANAFGEGAAFAAFNAMLTVVNTPTNGEREEAAADTAQAEINKAMRRKAN